MIAGIRKWLDGLSLPSGWIDPLRPALGFICATCNLVGVIFTPYWIVTHVPQLLEFDTKSWISKGAMYLQFPSKEEICFAFIKRVHARILVNLRTAVQDGKDILYELHEECRTEILAALPTFTTRSHPSVCHPLAFE